MRPFSLVPSARSLSLVLLAVAGPAAAQSTLNAAGSAACEAAATRAWPGDAPVGASDLERYGQYVMAGGPGLVVYDASDPARPTRVATFEPAGMPRVDRLEIIGDVAWLADDVKLVAVDISDPLAMREVHRFEPGWAITGLASNERGRVLSVVMFDSLLHLYDASDPTNPIEGVSSGIGSGGTLHHAFMGDVLVMATRDGFVTRGVPDAETFQDLGDVRLPARSMGLWIAGTTALVPCEGLGLVAYDLRDPTAPREAGRRTDLFARAATTTGSFAVVAAFEADGPAVGRPNTVVCVLDASDPDHLVAARTYTTARARDIVLVGRHAVLAADHAWLAVDLARPRIDSQLGFVELDPWPTAMAAHDAHAYAARDAVLTVLDITTPTKPMAIGTHEAGAPISGVWRAGGLLVLATGEGVELWSLADPASPVFLSGMAIPWPVLDVSVAGPRLAIAVACPQGLLLADIADPATPRIIGPAAFTGCPTLLDAAGTTLATAERDASWVSFTDISDPLAPRELSAYDAGGTVRDILLSGERAYVLAGGSVSVLDITRPSKPVLVGQSGTAMDGPGTLAVRNDMLIVRARDQIRMIDVGDPAVPQEIGSLYQTDVRAVAFTASEMLVAAGRGAGFVRVHGLGPCTPCPGDLDGDGSATVLDYLEFTNRFVTGDPGADYDADGDLTVLDFLAFERLFATGCI